MAGWPVCAESSPFPSPCWWGNGIIGSTRVGTSAPVVENKNFKKLSAQVNTDLGHLENSISHLETQVDSLAEIVFHETRRSLFGTGRNLLLLQQPVRVIRENSAMVRNNIEEREKRHQESDDRYKPCSPGSPG